MKEILTFENQSDKNIEPKGRTKKKRKKEKVKLAFKKLFSHLNLAKKKKKKVYHEIIHINLESFTKFHQIHTIA